MVKTLFVLAGGASSRFGSSKPRHVFRGKPLASWVAEAAQGAGLRPVLLVKDLGLAELGWPVFQESNSESFYPLRAMLEALSALPEGESALFCPCDLPLLRSDSLAALSMVSAPSVAWDGVRVHPLLCQLASSQAADLAEWVRQQGSAQGFLAEAKRVRIPAGELHNINRPEDLVSG